MWHRTCTPLRAPDDDGIPNVRRCCCPAVHRHRNMVYKDYLIAYVLKAKARQRRRSQSATNSGLNDTSYFARPHSAQLEKPLSDIPQPSYCPCCQRSNCSHSSDVFVRGDRLQRVQYHVVQQLQLPSDTVHLEPVSQAGVKPAKLRPRYAQATEADVIAASRHVRGSQHDSYHLAAGSMLFGAILFVCGSAPWLLPVLYLLFAAFCLPWRIQQFYKHSQGFFLLDFCYVSTFEAATAFRVACHVAC